MNRVIGVTIALRQEAFAIFGRRGWADSGGFLTRSERCGKRLFSIVITGPGRKAAVSGLEQLLQCRPDMVLNLGVAGALSEDLDSGDILSPGLLRHELLTLGISSGLKARMDKVLGLSGISSRDGILYTSEKVINATEEKGRLYRKRLAHAVDMEAFFLARGCERATIPFYTVKAISDTARHYVPEIITRCVAKNGAVDVSRLVTSLLFHPWLLPGLLEMKACFQRALYSLSLVKSAIISHLSQ